MGTKKYWLEICVRFSITNFRFDSGVDNRIIIVWEKNEKKIFRKEFLKFLLSFCAYQNVSHNCFSFFFSSNGRASILLRSLSFFHFFLSRAADWWIVECQLFYFFGLCVWFEFFFLFTLSKWECNCYLGGLCACAMSIIAGIWLFDKKFRLLFLLFSLREFQNMFRLKKIGFRGESEREIGERVKIVEEIQLMDLVAEQPQVHCRTMG